MAELRKKKETTLSLGLVIRNRREELELTQDKLATRVGISKPYLSNIETGKTKNPPADRIVEAIEQALDLPPRLLVKMAHLARTPQDVRDDHEMLLAEVRRLREVLRSLITGQRASLESADLGPEHLSPFAGASMPVVNRPSTDYPPHVDPSRPAQAGDYLRCPDVVDPKAFGVRVVGNAMEPDYVEGDVVVISPSTTAQSGDDCFVRFAGRSGTTFCRYYQDPQAVRLQPVNSSHSPRSYDSAEIASLWPAVSRLHRIRRH